MKPLRLHPLIAILVAVCLLGGQGAGYAHALTHLAEGQGEIGFQVRGFGDARTDQRDLASHLCVTCIAFAALASAPPSRMPSPEPLRLPSERPLPVPSVFVPAPPAPPYTSRAPPAVL